MSMISNEWCRAAVLAGPAAQEAATDSVAIKNNTEQSWKQVRAGYWTEGWQVPSHLSPEEIVTPYQRIESEAQRD